MTDKSPEQKAATLEQYANEALAEARKLRGVSDQPTDIMAKHKEESALVGLWQPGAEVITEGVATR
jgi:hypothetical protein